MLLIMLGILSLPFIIFFLLRKQDTRFVKSARQQGREIFKTKFSPSFFHTQRYSGVGFIELKNNSVIVFGRRKWPLRKKMIGFIIFTICLSLIGRLLGPSGAFFLSAFFFRSRAEDTYSLARIEGITRENPNRYLINFRKTNEDKRFKIAFESKEFNHAYDTISAYIYDKFTAHILKPNELTEIKSEFLHEQKEKPINPDGNNNFITKNTPKSNQLLAISEIEKRVTKGSINL